MANKLNMIIAKTHRLSTRVVGMQLTAGNFIGIALSATQMSAGFLIIGQPIIKGLWFMVILIALIGVALALLIERLSLGGLSAVRVAKEHEKQISDAYFFVLQRDNRVPSDLEKQNYERQVKALQADRQTATIFAAVGMLLSAGIGDVFWHSLFASMGWVGYILSTSCAAVIGLTFIHSELYKAIMDGVLKEILADMQLMRVAVAAEGQNMQLDMMVDAYDSVSMSKEAKEPAETKVRKVVVRQLSNFADQVNAASNEVASYNVPGTIVEGSLSPLALPAPRGKYGLHRAELLRLLRTNPTISDREIAKHFDVSRSTANGWKTKAQKGE